MSDALRSAHDEFVRQAIKNFNSPRVGQKVALGNGEIHVIIDVKRTDIGISITSVPEGMPPAREGELGR